MSSDRVRTRLQDIVDNADWIAEYVEGVTLEAFRTDRKTADAVERCLQRITQAVIQIGQDETEQAALGITWHEVRSLGNKLRHEYQRIDRTRVYTTALDDVSALHVAAARALKS